MDSTSSIPGFSTYPSGLSDGLCESAFGQDPQLDPENTFTQPVASRPIDLQCGDSDSDGDDDSAIGAFEQQVGVDATKFDSGGDFGSPQPL
jgi:hypothetical protein